MSKISGPRWCQQCGKYEYSGVRSDHIIILERVGKRLLCQNCKPKTKQVDVAPDTAQLSFEEKVEKNK